MTTDISGSQLHIDAREVPTGEPKAINGRRQARRWGRALLLSLLFLALIAIVTQPTPTRLNQVHGNIGDPVLNMWILRWGWHGLFTNPAHLFDANIFWPNPLTFAYSENLLGLAPVFNLFFYLTGRNPAVALNLTILALLFANLWATYVLVRWLCGRTAPAVLAAVGFTFTSYLLSLLGSIHLVPLFFLPLGFWLLFKLLENPRYTTGILLGACMTGLGLTSATYALAFVVGAVTVVAGFALLGLLGHAKPSWQAWLTGTALAPPRPNRKTWAALVLSLLVAGALMAPVGYQYYKLQQDPWFKRGPALDLTLDPIDLVDPGPQNILYRSWRQHLPDPKGVHPWFPGIVILALGGAGLVVLLRKPDQGNDENSPSPPILNGRRHYIWLLLLAGMATGVLALGPIVLGIPMPFEVLRRLLPGFSGVRATSRFAVVPWLSYVVLAAIGLSWILTRLKSVNWRSVVSVTVIALALVEHYPSLTYVKLSRSTSVLAIYDELADRPNGAVLELPIPHATPTAWPYLESPRMLYATHDWHPRINGYSGYSPQNYEELVNVFQTFPAREAIELLTDLNVRYVVLHIGDPNNWPGVGSEVSLLNETDATQIVQTLPDGMTAERFGDSYLIDLRPPI